MQGTASRVAMALLCLFFVLVAVPAPATGSCDIALDELVARDGLGAIPYTGTDQGVGSTGLRLTSMGRIYDGAVSISTVWRIRNAATYDQVVSLQFGAHTDGEYETFPVTARTELFYASSAVEGQATHRLWLGTAPRFIDRDAVLVNSANAETHPFDDDTVVEDPSCQGGGNSAPVITDQSFAATEDTPLTITVEADDADGDALTYIVLSGPASGSLSGTGPEFTYTPALNFAGTDSFSLAVDDGTDQSTTATITIQVAPVNDPPVVDPQTVTLDEDSTAPVTLSATDPDGDALTYRIDVAPSNGTLSGAAPTLTYTPNPDYNGSDYFIFVANDGVVDSVPEPVAITVDAVNDAPVAVPSAVSTPEDTTLPITLTGDDVDGDTLSYAVAVPPANGSLSGTPPTLFYMPAADFAGDDSFTFTTSDGALTSAEALVAITVLAVNDLPIANDLAINAVAGIAIAVPLSGTDADGDPLTYAVESSPVNGTLTGPADALVYTANAGFSGTDQLTYTASDGTATSSPATVTFTVVDNNTAPIIDSTPVLSAVAGVPYSYQVAATDGDGDSLSYTLTSAPDGMTVSGVGLVEWAAPVAGTYPIVIEVTDGRAGLVQQAFDLNVVDNQPPEFTQLPATNAPLGELYRSVGQVTDPDGDAVAVALTSSPAGSSLADLGGGRFELQWQPSGAVGDTTPFVVVATDSRGAEATLGLSVRITGDTINRSHLGTDFWLAFTLNYTTGGFTPIPIEDPTRKLQVIVGAPTGASGTVSISELAFSQAFSIPPGETAAIDLPNEAQRGESNYQNQGPGGVHVVSDTPVTVAGINWAGHTTDAWLAMPTPTLGTDYLVTGYTDHSSSEYSPYWRWAVLAIQDGTTFTATPRGTRPPTAVQYLFDPVTVTLNRGEYYYGKTDHSENLEVVSDNPVAVFGGTNCADVPADFGFCDHLWQQFVPENSLASDYLAAPLATRSDSMYRISATEDGTLVYLNDVYSARLDRGESVDALLPGPVAIRGSKPVVAVQYAVGDEYDRDVRGDKLADPFMLALAPADAYLSSYTFVVPSGDGVFREEPDGTPRPAIANHYLSIVVPVAAAPSLVLDGSPVDISGFEPVPGTSHLAGSLETSPGTHRLVANEQFGLTVYGFGRQESYGYYAGLSVPEASTALDVALTGPPDPLVAGSAEACVDIVTTDPGGARAARARYTVDVAGAFPLSFTGFTDQVGEARYCYTQPGPTADSITVAVNGGNAAVGVDWLADTDPATNGAPRILSVPELVLYEPVFDYPLAAADPDGDAITYAIEEAPPGATIAAGSLVWTPPVPADREPTTHDFTLLADDGNGGTDRQRFVVTVYYPATFVERFPESLSVRSGEYQSTFDHLGGDPARLNAEMIDGEGDTLWTGYPGATYRFTIDGQPQLIEKSETTDRRNPMCRADSNAVGQFGLSAVWEETADELIDAAVAGPVVDTNGDGAVDDADDIYAVFAERQSVALHNVTRRQYVWRNPIYQGTWGAYAALANVDDDIEAEALFVVSLADDTVKRLTAYNADGTLAWRSSHTPLAGDYLSGQYMPILPVDLDSDGTTEILYGPYVYDNAGNVKWQFDTARIGSGSDHALPLAVDLNGDGMLEVLFQTEVRDANGTLLWELPYPTTSERPQVLFAAGELSPDPGPEIVASVSTADGVFHEAFRADGSRLWDTPVEGPWHGVPMIMDLDRDGNADVLTSNGRAFISGDGVLLTEPSNAHINWMPSVMDLNRDGIAELVSFTSNSKIVILDANSRIQWYERSFAQTTGFRREAFWQSAMWIDPDHDGESELFIAGFSGTGLFESATDPFPLPSRRYSQAIDFSQPIIGFDTDFGTDESPGLADAWIGEIRLSQLTEQEFSVAADVLNKGLTSINEPFTVEFFKGRTSDGQLLGSVPVDRLDVNETRTVSIPADFADRADVMSARIVLDPATAQCETRNDEVEGELHTIELSDGETPYRTARWTYLHQDYYDPNKPSFTVWPVSETIELGNTYEFDADGGVSGQSEIGNGTWFGLSEASWQRGMRVNSATGEITWTPAYADVGSNVFQLRLDSVEDSRTLNFTITVEARANDAPVITTTAPAGLIPSGVPFSYDVDAVDSDNDPLTFALAEAPPGMAVDAATGLVTWTPTSAQAGANAVTISVDDGFGGVVTQTFVLTVTTPENSAPDITSAPPSGPLLPDQPFSYDVEATDPDGDPLTYALTVAPAGMTIDAATGLIAWTPTAAQVGANDVTVSVDDGVGGVATQSFALSVNLPGNTPPEITSVPPFTAKATFALQYQVVATDADGDALDYSLVTGPADMTIDASGLLSWTPESAGVESVRVRVTDGVTWVEQGWTLTIGDADIPLEATLDVSPVIVNVGEQTTFAIGYSGAAGPVSFALTIDGQAVTVDADGVAMYTPTGVGPQTATAIVSDPYASDSATATFTVIDPDLASTPPIVSLASPDHEEEVTAPRDAIGSVGDPDDDLTSWFLAIQRRGAPPTEYTIVAEGTEAVDNDVLGQIDPTMLMNGLYAVILQAQDAAGNTAQDVRVIRVTGNLKVGNFSVTFEDFSAPVAGIPVTVLRTYDSRQRTEDLDFGHGWSVDYQNVRLQESRPIGFSWTLIEEDFGLFSQWCVRPNGDPTVTVRLPDGEVESFVARAQPECTQITPTVDVSIVFEPIDGTDTTLEQTNFGTVRIVDGTIVDLSEPGVPIDPDSYRLTTPEGLVYELDQGFGIRRVIDTNENSLTYSSDGVVHSQGFALDFIRDAEGRIETIVAPDGTSMSYGYDANGDLTSFTDQVGNVTTFTYTNATDHYLEDIFEPRGFRTARNEYDGEGRLIAIVDADGNRIQYTHDIAGRTETVRDRRSNTTVYVYDDEGNVLAETNALGETITRTYDADRNVLTETNDLGETTSWTYDERGNQLTETNALGEITTSTYDDRNLLRTVVDPLGLPVMTNVYDTASTNLQTMTDALGHTTTFYWDAGTGSCSTGAFRGTLDAEGYQITVQPACAGSFAELPAWEEDGRGVRTTFTYGDLGRVRTETTTRTDALGATQTLVTTMEYDAKGRLFRVTDPEGQVTVTEWNDIDKEAATVDPRLNRTEYEYDDRGNLELTRYADNSTETTDYDAEGNPVAQTDRLGRTTLMTYDAANRLIETIFPDDTPGVDTDNPRIVNEYDRAGRLAATIDELGNRTEYEYDAAGRRTVVRDALLRETRYEYDARGLQTAMIDALDRRTVFVYDDAGRLVETIYPGNLTGSSTYDGLGRKVSETDLAGRTTAFEYDAVGNLTAVVDALSQRTEYGYDEQSNKASQTDAELRTTTWGYDNAGRVTSRTLPEGQQETFSYDAAGNRTGHVDFNGDSHTFDYDGLNREIQASYADGTVVTTTYTDTGQVETITDDRGTTGHVYDARDRLTRLTYPTGRAIDYGYDAAGNRTSLDTAQQTVTYTFDALNRLETVIDQAGTTTYGYDEVGNRASVDYANGTRTTYDYDALYRLLEISHLDDLGGLMDQHSYTLGPNGNRLRHAELNGRVVDYGYDALYRLTEETVTDPGLGNRTATWTYDATGNRLSQTETDASGTTVTTYTYDANDRLQTETATGAQPSATTYDYDANGNTLSRSAGVTTSYDWDSRNRLTSLNGGQVTYRYDAAGIRMSETAGLTTEYLVDPLRDYAQVIEEHVGASPDAEVLYTYGDDLIGQHRRVNEFTTASSTYHYDGLGSTRVLTDALGLVTDAYAYTAFGELEGSSGSTTNDYLYTGEQLDRHLDLYYLRARYFSPEIGRFQRMDTWLGADGRPVTLHKYIYGNASPLNHRDPTGQAAISDLTASQSVFAVLTVSTLAAVHNHKSTRYKASLVWDFTELVRSVNAALAELVMLNTRHTKDVINGLLLEAEKHAEKIGSSPPEDPDKNHWKGEVKAFLQRAKRLAEKRLKGRTREVTIQRIERIAAKAGVTL